MVDAREGLWNANEAQLVAIGSTILLAEHAYDGTHLRNTLACAHTHDQDINTTTQLAA
jgi:hypothetical protein